MRMKVKRLDNRVGPTNGLRLAKLGDVLTLNSGDIVGIAPHNDACCDHCYFASNDGALNFCKGAYIVKREVPDFDLYIRPAKFKNCFLRTGWHFVKIGNKKEGM